MLDSSGATLGVTQIIFGLVIVAMLLFLGSYYAWRQVRNLRLLRMLQTVSPVVRRDAHRQAWRRLICSGFMLIFAGLLVGSFFLEGEAQRHADQAKAARDRGEEPVFTPEEKDFQRVWGWYWFISLLVLLAIIVLAAVDVFAIRRIGQRLHKQLQDERRDMIAEQLARLRSEQNEREVR